MQWYFDYKIVVEEADCVLQEADRVPVYLIDCKILLANFFPLPAMEKGEFNLRLRVA